MSILFAVFVALVIFSFLVLIHEFGHFYTARKCGVTVEEFSIGFGPILWKKQKKGVKYMIKAIPFGGYVKMLGEEKALAKKGSFSMASLWQRMAITVAGVVMNLVFAIVALTIVFSIGSDPILVSKADLQSAFKNGQVVFLTQEGEKISHRTEDGKALINFWQTGEPTKNLSGKKLKISYEEKIKKSLLEAFLFSWSESLRISKSIVQKVGEIPGEIIRNKQLPKELQGPVGITRITEQIIPQGFLALFRLAALLSLSLAVMNLLPIPALDGGRLLFQLVELILKPFKIGINERIEDGAHIAGFVLLIGFFIAITWRDLVVWIWG